MSADEVPSRSDCTVSSQQVKRSVDALYKLLEMKASKRIDKKKKFLFDKAPNKISVRIQLKRAPAGKQYGWKEIKLNLPYCPSGGNQNICLIVKDVRKGRKAEDDITLEYFKDLMKKNDITCISEIIPLHIIRTEYNTFHTKKNLSISFDKFIADERIKMILPTLLGRSFIEKQKLPIPVNLIRSTAKTQIEKAVKTVILPIYRNKFIYHVNVANDSMPRDETIANVLMLLNQLAGKLPGGWVNVGSVFLSTVVKPSIPVYASLDPAFEVTFPINWVEKPEAEELTTLEKGKVIVYPDGESMIVDDDFTDDDQ